LLAAFGIVAAVHGRGRTGRGTYIDVSMYQGLLALLQSSYGWTRAGAPDPSWGRGLLSGAVPFYDCYRTKDGHWYSVAALEPKFYANLVDAIGRPDLHAAYDRPDRWPEVREGLQLAFSSRTLAEWEEVLSDVDTAVAPVRSLVEAFSEGRREGVVNEDMTVGPVPRMTGWDSEVGQRGVQAGQHTRQVLQEAEYDEETISTLLRNGAVAEETS